MEHLDLGNILRITIPPDGVGMVVVVQDAVGTEMILRKGEPVVITGRPDVNP